MRSGWAKRPWAPAVALAISLAIVPTLGAAEVKLSGPEISALLTGNSVEGVWDVTPYRSYFAPNGETLYQPHGREVDHGSWRVAGDQYCAQWDVDGETCYDLYLDGDIVIWVLPDSGEALESKLIEGKAVPW